MADNFLKLRKVSMFICAILIFVYLSILCFINPSKELLFAIAVELFSFGGYLFFARRRSNSSQGKADEAVFSELSHQYTVVHQTRRIFSLATSAFWLAAAIALTIDCFAFSAAFAGARNISLAVYRAVPISYLLGLHPAASLEVLAGDFVEAHKYEQALPFYEEVLALRLSTFGKVHKEIAAIYCDFGDLATHQNQLIKAEACYRVALAISTSLLGDKGSGRAFTRLADCLRDQGKFAEANNQYQSAYDMRARQFGPNSSKVGETLAEWVKLLRLEGKQAEAAQMQKRIDLISRHHREMPPLLSAFFSLCLFAISLLVSNLLLGRKGILTELVVGKIKASVDAASNNEPAVASTGGASKSQLGRLITLYKFQKKHDEAAHYSELLARMSKD